MTIIHRDNNNTIVQKPEYGVCVRMCVCVYVCTLYYTRIIIIMHLRVYHKIGFQMRTLRDIIYNILICIADKQSLVSRRITTRIIGCGLRSAASCSCACVCVCVLALGNASFISPTTASITYTWTARGWSSI